MNLDVQFKINQDSNLRKYLHENSYWYKTLNRHPEKLPELISEMKESYRLRPIDKVSDILGQMELIQSLLGLLR